MNIPAHSFGMNVPAFGLHACMGDSCYCRPGNEHFSQWTAEDRQNLRKALDRLAAIERVGSDTKGG